MKRSTICVLSALALVACGPVEREKEEVEKPVRVKVRAVEIKEFRIPVRATGILGTATEMKLSFKTGGIIREVHVGEGVSVARGEVLAVLDLSEITAQVNQARIGLEKAERDLERAANLYQDSVVTLEQYQNARSAYELAKSQKSVADFNLQHSRIIAPANGKVQKVLVETNEVIGPGYPAILFASTENDWVVRAALTDKDIVRLSIGDSARIRMDAFPNVDFSAIVTELGSVADPVTGSYEVELLLQETLPQFRTGFFSRVEIFPAGLEHSMVVPIESLIDASDRDATVFIYDQGRARLRRIETGLILGAEVVVTLGLEPGDLVITDGARYLKDDMEVEL
jgi:multidrug efflux system membrane fusion protein